MGCDHLQTKKPSLANKNWTFKSSFRKKQWGKSPYSPTKTLCHQRLYFIGRNSLVNDRGSRPHRHHFISAHPWPWRAFSGQLVLLASLMYQAWGVSGDTISWNQGQLPINFISREAVIHLPEQVISQARPLSSPITTSTAHCLFCSLSLPACFSW